MFLRIFTAIAAVLFVALFTIGCGGGGDNGVTPPPPGGGQLIIVDRVSGADVSAGMTMTVNQSAVLEARGGQAPIRWDWSPKNSNAIVITAFTDQTLGISTRGKGQVSITAVSGDGKTAALTVVVR